MSKSNGGTNQVSPTYPMGMDDDHILPGGKGPMPGAINQHHRMAMGEKVTGTSNPYGAQSNTKNMIGNNQGKRY